MDKDWDNLYKKKISPKLVILVAVKERVEASNIMKTHYDFKIPNMWYSTT